MCYPKITIVRSADQPIVRLMKWSRLAPDFWSMVIMAKAIKKPSILQVPFKLPVSNYAWLKLVVDWSRVL